MKPSFFKTTFLVIIIFSLTLSPLENVFVNGAKVAEAQTSVGGAVGKALAAGAACFLETKLESWLAGTATRVMPDAIAEGYAQMLKYPVAVPTVSLNNPAVAKSTETSDALMSSKDCIRDVIAKIILDWVVDETITWIQGGGEPKYVTNWDNFLEDAFNVGVGEVIKETNLAFLCSPFQLQVQLSLLPVQRFPQRIECTLDNIVANIEDFYEDFENGGWIAYNESWQPQNNYYGQMIMIHDEIITRSALAREAAQNEALAGKGFLSQKRCKGGGISAQERAEIEFYDPDQIKGYTKDSKGNYCSPEEMEIITPGDVIGKAAGEAITSDITWAANIKSWVAALINAVINRLIKEGIGLMKRSDEPQVTGGDGDFDPYEGYDPARDAKKNYIAHIVSQYNNLLTKFNAVLTLKNQSLSYVQQTIIIFKELKRRNCEPLVSDTDITDLQGEERRLTTEIFVDIPNIISVINANLTKAQNVSGNYTNREFALIEQEYNDFNTDYVSVILDIYSGNTERLAQDEAQNKQTELSNAQTRFNTCVIGQSLPSGQ